MYMKMQRCGFFLIAKIAFMTVEELQRSLHEDGPPETEPLIIALWWDAKGNWSRAHEIAQEVDSAQGAWVHAYLHRKEGDAWNAEYWYRKAGKLPCKFSLDEEWADIIRHLLAA
jgi:hypothetical protein